MYMKFLVLCMCTSIYGYEVEAFIPCLQRRSCASKRGNGGIVYGEEVRGDNMGESHNDSNLAIIVALFK